ncbi:PH domain-containing protein [Candidatus Uhrbacteria bacterium]|nr:PH domain-containing protein [Candidatus Uhrbacteria bacterium]
MSLFIHDHTILKVRRHPLTFFMQIIIFLILLSLPSLLDLGLKIIDYPIPDDEIVQYFRKLIGTIYYLYIFLFILYSFFDYFLDVWIVTDRYIIDIEQRALFFRSIVKQEIIRIQDVTAEVRGIIPTLFNYGDVHIQTAGALERIVFHKVPNPNGVVSVVLKTLEEQQKKMGAASPMGH